MNSISILRDDRVNGADYGLKQVAGEAVYACFEVDAGYS